MSDVFTITKDVLDAIQKLQPGLEAAAKAATSMTTVGGTVVQLVLQGKKLYTYLIGQNKKKDGAQASSQVGEPISADEIDAAEIEATQDVAILVDINRRMLPDVMTFLEKQEIDANLFIVTNDPTYGSTIRFLEPEEPAEWTTLVQEFNEVMGVINRSVGNAQLHIFLSTPLALAFGLGAVWGTVDNATVYHWQDNTYHPAMEISRRLRSA